MEEVLRFQVNAANKNPRTPQNLTRVPHQFKLRMHAVSLHHQSSSKPRIRRSSSLVELPSVSKERAPTAASPRTLSMSVFLL